MLLVLEMDVADLAATRFAISPLSETVRAVQLLAQRETPAVNAPWVRWARGELGWRPLRLPRLWPLIVNGLPVHPEFLVPAPEARMPEFGAELARLRATPASAVEAGLHRLRPSCCTRPRRSGSPCSGTAPPRPGRVRREGAGLLRLRGHASTHRGPRSGLPGRRGGHRGGRDRGVPVGLARLEGPRPGHAAAHRRARVRRGGRDGRARGAAVARRGPGDGAVRLRLRPV